MSGTVQPAQCALRLVVAHQIVHSDDLLQSLVDRGRTLFGRFSIGSDLEDCAHDVLFLVNENWLISVLGARTGGQNYYGERRRPWLIEAHKSHRSNSRYKYHRPSGQERIAWTSPGRLSTQFFRWPNPGQTSLPP